MNGPVPVNSVSLHGNEQRYLEECIRTGWISSEGPFVARFEAAIAELSQRRFAIAVSSGTAALDIAISALGIAAGDEVIMPAFTIISPAMQVVRVGAVPVLIDSDPLTFNLDVAAIEAKITPRTKAIVAVHLYGLPVDMDPLLALAAKYKLKVIEDAAEMHGQTYKGRPCGSFGDISIFSFYANKHISCGEGGMVMTNDPVLAASCRKLRNLCFDPELPRFVHRALGWNYRLTNLQAAVGLAQAEQLTATLEKKRAMGVYYRERLAFLEDAGYQLPLAANDHAESCYWVFTLVAPNEREKERLVSILHEKRIGTRPFFWCLHEQPVFQEMGLFAGETYPVAERLGRCGFYVPSGVGLTRDEQNRVIACLRDAFSGS